MFPRLRVRSSVVVAALLLTAAAACTSGPPPPVDARPYDAQIQSWRADKDAMLRTSADSPIPAANRASFPGLPYFPIDPAYHVPASLTAAGDARPVVMELPTSTAQRRRVVRAGALAFTINGTPLTLTAFADEGRPADRLFVPFGDLTNGQDTYEGGRYMELDRTPTGLYDMDFNRAFHPYCVYNSTYDCPVPPRENRMPIAVRAGERLAR